MSVWVMVSDSRRARIFDVGKNGAELNELADFTNQTAREYPPALNRRSLDARGGAWHGLAPRETPQQHDAQLFAGELAEYLYKEWATHHFEDLVLVAAPEWLGTLRQALPGGVTGAIRRTINKDLTRAGGDEIIAQLVAARPLTSNPDQPAH